MSEFGEPSEASLFATFDVIDIAKSAQWDISLTDDPTEAALKSSVAIADIHRFDDRRLRSGTTITVKALSALIMNAELEGGMRGAALLDDMVVQGVCAGFGFIQNFGEPRLQTLFLGIRQARTLEVREDEDGIWVSRIGRQPLVIPVLDIDSIASAA